MKNIGSRIKLLRKQLGKSLGLTKQAISNMENSKSAPSPAVLYKMHIEFDVNLNYIITGLGDLYVSEKGANRLKDTLMKEFEAMLNARGIK